MCYHPIETPATDIDGALESLALVREWTRMQATGQQPWAPPSHARCAPIRSGLTLIGALAAVLTSTTLVACGSRGSVGLDGSAPDSALLTTPCAGGAHARVNGTMVAIRGVQISGRPDMMSALVAFTVRLFKAGAGGEVMLLVADLGGSLVQRPDGSFRLDLGNGADVRAADLPCSLLDAACMPAWELSRAVGDVFSGWIAIRAVTASGKQTWELSACAKAQARPGGAGDQRSLELFVPFRPAEPLSDP